MGLFGLMRHRTRNTTKSSIRIMIREMIMQMAVKGDLSKDKAVLKETLRRLLDKHLQHVEVYGLKVEIDKTPGVTSRVRKVSLEERYGEHPIIDSVGTKVRVSFTIDQTQQEWHHVVCQVMESDIKKLLAYKNEEETDEE